MSEKNDIMDRYFRGEFIDRQAIKTLGEEMRIMQKGITDEKVLLGFNMAIALCNKHIGERSEE